MLSLPEPEELRPGRGLGLASKTLAAFVSQPKSDLEGFR